MASMNTRLNIEKLDGNIVQKHGGSKQVGFKQLGPGVETGVHGVHDEKRVWFEVELQGAQGDREAEVFQVSNDDTAVAQRRLIKGLHNNVQRVRIHNEKLVQTLLKGHSILSLEGSVSGDCDVEKNGKWSCIYAVGSQEYQMVCTRLDIASADMGMLDKFNRELQTDVQVFVDFDYAMGKSIG
ncbi:hypothetical protein Tco_0984442 [Tanacetum coccineum]